MVDEEKQADKKWDNVNKRVAWHKAGLCPTCGEVETHKIWSGGQKRMPLTIKDKVYKGKCLKCHPNAVDGNSILLETGQYLKRIPSDPDDNTILLDTNNDKLTSPETISGGNQPPTNNVSSDDDSAKTIAYGLGWDRTIGDSIHNKTFRWVQANTRNPSQTVIFGSGRSYVRAIEYDGVDVSGVTLIPSNESRVDSCVKSPNGTATIADGSDIVSAHKLSLENKIQWFQKRCDALCEAVVGNGSPMDIYCDERHTPSQEYIFYHSVEKVTAFDGSDLRKPWIVRSETYEETGIIPTAAWYELIFASCRDVGLWQGSEDEHSSVNGEDASSAGTEDRARLQINLFSEMANPDHLKFFRFYGRILGKALLDKRVLPNFRLTQHLYKLILGWPLNLDDLKKMDERYYNFLKSLKDMGRGVNILGLRFTVSEDLLGSAAKVPLIPNGENVKVEESNLEEYIDACLQYHLFGRCRSQVKEIITGFFEVIPEPLLVPFNYRELEALMTGSYAGGIIREEAGEDDSTMAHEIELRERTDQTRPALAEHIDDTTQYSHLTLLDRKFAAEGGHVGERQASVSGNQNDSDRLGSTASSTRDELLQMKLDADRGHNEKDDDEEETIQESIPIPEGHPATHVLQPSSTVAPSDTMDAAPSDTMDAVIEAYIPEEDSNPMPVYTAAIATGDSYERNRRIKFGQCPSCGMQTHKLRKFHAPLPLSNKHVLNGRCLQCNPLITPPSAGLQGSLHESDEEPESTIGPLAREDTYAVEASLVMEDGPVDDLSVDDLCDLSLPKKKNFLKRPFWRSSAKKPNDELKLGFPTPGIQSHGRIMGPEETKKRWKKNGLCLKCGSVQTHKKSTFGKWKKQTIPGLVHKGICLKCHSVDDFGVVRLSRDPSNLVRQGVVNQFADVSAPADGEQGVFQARRVETEPISNNRGDDERQPHLPPVMGAVGGDDMSVFSAVTLDPSLDTRFAQQTDQSNQYQQERFPDIIHEEGEGEDQLPLLSQKVSAFKSDERSNSSSDSKPRGDDVSGQPVDETNDYSQLIGPLPSGGEDSDRLESRIQTKMMKEDQSMGDNAGGRPVDGANGSSQLVGAIRSGGEGDDRLESRIQTKMMNEDDDVDKLTYNSGDKWERIVLTDDIYGTVFQWAHSDAPSAYVRKIQCWENYNVITLVPPEEALLDPTITNRDGQAIMDHQDIMSAQKMVYEDKIQWFRNTCNQLRVEEDRCSLRIRRDSILTGTLEFVMPLSRNDLQKPWDIKIVGDEADGKDALGKWLELVIEEMINPDLGLWKPDGLEQMVTINSSSEKDCPGPWDHLIYYRCFGRVLGKALFDGQQVNCRFSSLLYKHLLGWPIVLDDMSDSNYFNFLKSLKDLGAGIDHLGLNFAATSATSDGPDVDVNEKNLPDYIDACLKYQTYARQESQLNAIILGFFDVMSETLLSIFDYRELEKLTCAPANTKRSSYSRTFSKVQIEEEANSFELIAKECLAQQGEMAFETDPAPLSMFVSRVLWPRSMHDFIVGLRVDCIHDQSQKQWFVGSVIDIIYTEEKYVYDERINTAKVKVHFDSYSSKWDQIYSIDDFYNSRLSPLYTHSLEPKPNKFTVHFRGTNAKSKSLYLFGQPLNVSCKSEWSVAKAGAFILKRISNALEVFHFKSPSEKTLSPIERVIGERSMRQTREMLSSIIEELVNTDCKYISSAIESGEPHTSLAQQLASIADSLSRKMNDVLPLLPFEIRVTPAQLPLGSNRKEAVFPFLLDRSIGNYITNKYSLVLHWREERDFASDQAHRETEAEELRREGDLCFNSCNLTEAIELYTRAIELNPNESQYLANRSAAYSRLGLTDKAVKDTSSILLIKPTCPRSYYQKGSALSLLDRNEDAISVFEEGLMKYPSDSALSFMLSSTRESHSSHDMVSRQDTFPNNAPISDHNPIQDPSPEKPATSHQAQVNAASVIQNSFRSWLCQKELEKRRNTAEGTGSSCGGDNIRAQWYYYVQNNEENKPTGWHKYDDGANQEVERLHTNYLATNKAARYSKRVVESESSGFQYLVDLLMMQQTNIVSERLRPITRTCDGHPPNAIPSGVAAAVVSAAPPKHPDDAATAIQSVARSWLCMKGFELKLKQETCAAIRIQSMIRSGQCRAELAKKKKADENADVPDDESCLDILEQMARDAAKKLQHTMRFVPQPDGRVPHNGATLEFNPVVPSDLTMGTYFRKEFKDRNSVATKGTLPTISSDEEDIENARASLLLMAENANSEPVQLPPKYVQEIRTEQKIGGGYYGKVVLGEDKTIGMSFAIKLIEPLVIEQSLAGLAKGRLESIQKTFRNEIKVLTNLSHPNMATLYGYCIDEVGIQNTCLVYELAVNGSLDKFWKDELGRQRLSDPKLRARIALEVATVLRYMHEGLDGGAVCYHRDIKSANVCLTEDFSVRVVDCGLSKYITESSGSFSSAGPTGTPGYTCPDYLMRAVFSSACDVFSFGVMLCDLITGRSSSKQSPHYLTYKKKGSKKLEDNADQYVDWESSSVLKKLTKLALQCMRSSPEDRPSIGKIVYKLQQIHIGRGRESKDTHGIEINRLLSLSSEEVSEIPTSSENLTKCKCRICGEISEKFIQCCGSTKHTHCQICVERHLQRATILSNFDEMTCLKDFCDSKPFHNNQIAAIVSGDTWKSYSMQRSFSHASMDKVASAASKYVFDSSRTNSVSTMLSSLEMRLGKLIENKFREMHEIHTKLCAGNGLPCPKLFALREAGSASWRHPREWAKNVGSVKLMLSFICARSGEPVSDKCSIKLRYSRDWLKAIGPALNFSLDLLALTLGLSFGRDCPLDRLRVQELDEWAKELLDDEERSIIDEARSQTGNNSPFQTLAGNSLSWVAEKASSLKVNWMSELVPVFDSITREPMYVKHRFASEPRYMSLRDLNITFNP